MLPWCTLNIRVTQVYTSALSLGQYASPIVSNDQWERIATLILYGAYEATLLEASRIASERGQTVKVFLTKLGLGVFGNDPSWVAQAISHAVNSARNQGADIEVFICHHRAIDRNFAGILDSVLVPEVD